jgi:signal transduction histidine kinase
MYQNDGAVHGDIAGVLLADGSVGSVAIWSSSLTLDGQDAIIWALLDLTEELNAKRELKDLNFSLELRRNARLHWSGPIRNCRPRWKPCMTQSELLSAEKMASLGSLVAGIAHELNTPIGNSLLASTSLRDRVIEFDRKVAAGALRRSADGASGRSAHGQRTDFRLAAQGGRADLFVQADRGRPDQRPAARIRSAVGRA